MTSGFRNSVSPARGPRMEEEMRSPAVATPGNAFSTLSGRSSNAFHPKKDDDVHVSVAVDWTMGASEDEFNRPLGSPRGARRQRPGQPTRADALGNAGATVSAMALRAVDEANRLGTERVVLMLLSVVTIITGVLAALSAPRVFINNYVFRTWSAHLLGGDGGPQHPSPLSGSASGANDASMPAIPSQILFLDHALWRFGVPAVAVGAFGLLASRVRRINFFMYLYILLGVIFALACLLTIGVASSQHYLADGEEELSVGLHHLWKRLARSPEKSGHPALCDLQSFFTCSGFSICCVTNATEIPEDELYGEDGLPGAAWGQLCFVSLPNGTRVDRRYADVTEVVNRDCAHMLVTGEAHYSDEGSNSYPSGEPTVSSSSSSSASTSTSASQPDGSPDAGPVVTSSHGSSKDMSSDTQSKVSLSHGGNPFAETTPDTTGQSLFGSLQSLPEPAEATKAAASLFPEMAVRGASVLDTSPPSPYCPLTGSQPDEQWIAALSPCKDKLVGSLTSSLGFVLCAVFTLAGFCAVGVGFAIAIVRDALRRPTLPARDDVNLRHNEPASSLEVMYSPLPSKGKAAECELAVGKDGSASAAAWRLGSL